MAFMRKGVYPTPRFKNPSQKPLGVIDTACGGLALAKQKVNGEEQQVKEEEEECETQPIYDEKKFIMEELGIDPEELEQE